MPAAVLPAHPRSGGSVGLSRAAAALLALAAIAAAVGMALPFSSASLRSARGGFLRLRTDVAASPSGLCLAVVSEAVEADPALGAQLPPEVLAGAAPGSCFTFLVDWAAPGMEDLEAALRHALVPRPAAVRAGPQP